MIERLDLLNIEGHHNQIAIKINELIEYVNALSDMHDEIKHNHTALDTKQEKIGSGHTGACQEGCQCDVAKMGKQEKCQEICKHNRRGRCMQCEKEDEGKKFNGTGTMGEK